jgi:hypothetical protein
MNKTQLLTLRLASHQLLATQLHAPEAAVAWLGAVQAQDFSMAKMAIGIRLASATSTTVTEDFDRGNFLRTHVLRPTWHFVSPENIRWMLALSAAKIIASARSRDRDLEITEALYSKANRTISRALEGNKNLTRDELAAELKQAKINADTSRMYHFTMRAELEGIVCSGAVQGKKQTYALLSERAPAARILPREESLARLADIYFRSHSPATLQDFAWWSGLSLTEARRGLDAVKTNFVAEAIGEKTYWINPAFNHVLSAPQTEMSIHFLPAFDEYIIAYADRSAIIPIGNSKAISSNGVFRPTLVVNGQVAGIWRKTASKKMPVEVEFFEQPSKAVKQAVDKCTP